MKIFAKTVRLLLAIGLLASCSRKSLETNWESRKSNSAPKSPAKFANEKDFAVYAEKLRQLAVLKVEPMIQLPLRDEKKLFQKTEDFVRRTNPKFDLSGCRLVGISNTRSKAGATVMINKREYDGAIGGIIAEVSFDTLGELQFVHWFNMPEQR